MKIDKETLNLMQTKIIMGKLGITTKEVEPEQFMQGLLCELEEHGVESDYNITNNDDIMTGKIVAAHILGENIPDYYTRLEAMENEGEEEAEEPEDKSEVVEY